MKIYYSTLLFIACSLIGSENPVEKQLTFSEHVNRLELYLNENNSHTKDALLSKTVESLISIAHHKKVLIVEQDRNSQAYKKFQNLRLQPLIELLEKENIASQRFFDNEKDSNLKSLIQEYPFIKTVTIRSIMQIQLALHNNYITFTPQQQKKPIYNNIRDFKLCCPTSQELRCSDYNHRVCQEYHLFKSKLLPTIDGYENAETRAFLESLKAGLVQLYISTEEHQKALLKQAQTPRSSVTQTKEQRAEEVTKIIPKDIEQNVTLQEELIETKSNIMSQQFAGATSASFSQNPLTKTTNEKNSLFSSSETKKVTPNPTIKRPTIRTITALCILYLAIKYFYPHAYDSVVMYITNSFAMLNKHF